MGHANSKAMQAAASAESEIRAALFAAASDGKVDKLRDAIARGGDIEALDTAGYTPLCAASERGQIECMKVLLEAGANINRRMVGGTALVGSSLIAATRRGKIDAATFLLEHGADPRISDGSLNTAGHTLICSPDVFKGQDARAVDLLRLMLDKGLPVDQVNNTMQTMLSRSVRGNAPVAITELLLSRGANPSIVDNQGKAPIHWVTESKKIPHLRLLVESGADINATCVHGRTALFYAGDSEVMREMLELGADVNHRCNLGLNVISNVFETRHVGANPDDITWLLLDAGADLRRADYSGRTALDVLHGQNGTNIECCRRIVGAHLARETLRSASEQAKRAQPVV